MDIILARHGETAWNVGEVFRGRANVGLNDNGRKQAALLGEFLRDEKIETIFSSPLGRSLETAEAIAARQHLTVRVEDRLNDLNFGEWEGLTVPEVRARYGGLFATWESRPELVRLPGGETLDDVRHRALSLVDEAVSRHDGRTVLVTHRVVIKVLVCALLGLDNSHFWNIMVDTCGLTTFRHQQGRFVLIRHNDNAFLRPLGKKGSTDF